MKRLLTVCLFISTTNLVLGQNLVQNPGFETNRFCPNLAPRGNNTACLPWLQLGRRLVPALLSLFPNRCEPATDGLFQNLNFAVIRTGKGSAEFGRTEQYVQSQFIDAYSYLTIPLIEPLDATDVYYFEMYVSPNDFAPMMSFIPGTVATLWPKNSFGASFTNTQPSDFDFGPLDNFQMQITNKNDILKIGSGQPWNRIKDCLKPKGGEQFMTLGVIKTIPTASQVGYVDDITLVKLPREHKIKINKCNKGDWELDATLNINIPLDVIKYKWQDGSTQPILKTTKEGTYIVEVQVECKTYRDTVEVAFLDIGRDTTICRGTQKILTVSKPNNWNSFLWSDGTRNTPNITVRDAANYSVNALVRNCQTSDTARINIDDKPSLKLPADSTLFKDEPLILSVNLKDGVIKWPDGSAGENFKITKAGTYTVEATNRCGVTVQKIKIEEQDCSVRIFVPDAFTPNGDGINDFMDVFINSFYPIKQTQLTVFNRWGEVVYTTENLSDRWNGTYKGNTLLSDTYAWKLQVSYQKGENVVAKVFGAWFLLK